MLSLGTRLWFPKIAATIGSLKHLRAPFHVDSLVLHSRNAVALQSRGPGVYNPGLPAIGVSLVAATSWKISQ